MRKNVSNWQRRCLMNIGSIRWRSGFGDDALVWYRRALEAYQADGDQAQSPTHNGQNLAAKGGPQSAEAPALAYSSHPKGGADS